MSSLLPLLPSNRECVLHALSAYGTAQLFRCSQPAQVAALIFTANMVSYIVGWKAIREICDNIKLLSPGKRINATQVLSCSKHLFLARLAQQVYNRIGPRALSYIQITALSSVSVTLVSMTEHMIQLFTPLVPSDTKKKG